ncbi:hypothetical protein EUX98_g8880 [Antrodiella citrinella]|uniref:DUF6534 domain-containing protein n=1 Tax=Antrodiella citrinella TaxID=2447956 RepID=A0A4S4M1Q2_9APHY|nr:hypothetical protein EUX98_g8880 [Antrodiella citrinella]
MQAVLYFRIYPRDNPRIKLIVGLVWLLDLLHSVMVSAANWSYLIDNFGNPNVADTIFWSVAVTIAFTAVITFIVHCFFCHRILTLSRYNWFITTPIFILAFTRLGELCATLPSRNGRSSCISYSVCLRMDSIIDSITVYTIESGLLTSVVTVVSLVFWVTMSNNLIFLALHFAISKLYANAFLAT